MGIVTGVRVGRITDGIARHILWISKSGALCVTIAMLIINDLELIPQNPFKDRKRGQFCRRRVTELLRQGEEILTRFAKAAPGNTRRRTRKCALTPPTDIAVDDFLADPRVKIGVKALKLTGELRDALCNDAKPCQCAHRRTKGCRIHALTAGINRERPHQSIRQMPEQQSIKTLFDEQTAIVAQGLLTKIALRFAAYVQGMVPCHI